MKKLISVLLVLAIFVTTAAMAADTLSFTSKTGKYAPTIKTKSNSTGSNGSVNVTANAGSHSMYYQIHKANGGAATEYYNTKSTGTHALAYDTDGYGESLGRNGYSYRLRVAHRSQCTCSSGAATVTVDFTP